MQLNGPHHLKRLNPYASHGCITEYQCGDAVYDVLVAMQLFVWDVQRIGIE